MGRGVSSGGGQSSLNYLFGSNDPKPATAKTETVVAAPPPVKHVHVPVVNEPPPKPTEIVPQPDDTNKIPAGIQGSQANNYFRAEGQNTGNFLTDRPSTKVHAAPGGGSSLGYLFGDGSK
ncbi:SPIRAL1-like protein 2 [Tanacetum coccineum]